ncbi:hypothetical protein [uncultured Modestobacter sp.]|uniref:hypothetical protein n=1 Tax=uncultured Modestobacter sp. TaxID=380048 RepID=UPI00261793B3|nr:hypothetical protein [uncultured Modestobacter sp.]
MGVEAATLLVALGEQRLPYAYALHVKDSTDAIRGFVNDPAVPGWRRAANEVLLKPRRTVDEERAATAQRTDAGKVRRAVS